MPPIRDEPAPSASAGGDARWMLLWLSGGWFFVLGLRFVVPALLPFITRDFPVSNALAGAAITLMWVTYAVIQFPAGVLIDKIGERVLLVASLLLSCLSLVLFLGSFTFLLFLVATTVFGLGTGLFAPARGTVLARTFVENDGFAFGTVLAAGSLGAASLPVVGTLVAGRLGWRVAIAISLPGFVLAAVGLWWTVPARSAPAREADGGHRDVVRGVRKLLAAIRAPGISLAVAAVTLMLFATQAVTAFLTTYLVDVRGLTEGTAGALFGLLFVAGALFQWFGGKMADRFGHGPVLAAISFLSVPPLLALPYTRGLIPLAVVSALLGLRLVMDPISNAYIVSLLPVDVRGTAWGLLRAAFFTVGAFGSTVVGLFADRSLFAEAFVLLGLMTALAGVLYLFLPSRDAVTG